MASVHDTTGRCSPINGNNDSKVSFGFTQEQVECVCEVSGTMEFRRIGITISLYLLKHAGFTAFWQY